MVQPDREADFDTHDRQIAENPYPTYARLRAMCPVVKSRAWGGFWAAVGHGAVAAAARDDSLRPVHTLPDGTIQGVSIPSLGQTGRLVPLEMDLPASRKYRKLLASFYSAARVRARRAEFRGLATRCVDEVIDLGRCDIVEALTLRLPGILIMRDVGLPEERWREVDSVIQRAILSSPHDLDGAREGALMVCQEVVEAIEARRSGETPAFRGIIDHLMQCQIDGAPVPDNDIVAMIYLLLLGIDPTSTLAATGLWLLTKNPEVRARLIADFSLVPKATEEFLRWVTPIQATCRTAAADVSLEGQVLSADDRVLLSWASANHDETVFPEAERVKIDRRLNRHLAFGHGAHYCLGAHMVRAMTDVILEEVLTRMPKYELDDEKPVEWFPDLSSVYGVSALPIRFSRT